VATLGLVAIGKGVPSDRSGQGLLQGSVPTSLAFV